MQGTPAVASQQPQASAQNAQRQAQASKPGRSKLEKKSGKYVMLLLAAIVLIVIGVYGVTAASIGLITSGVIKSLTNLISSSSLLIAGFAALFLRRALKKHLSRYKKHYAFIGGRGIVSIPDIARSSGRSEKAAARDIQTMINNGYLRDGAYIDNDLNSLVIDADAAKQAREAKQSTQAAPAPAADKPVNQYMAIIVELRELNESIVDFAISAKIERIEELTAKIFRIVEEDASKLPQIRRFMNYYLPTTLKLLRSYALLEKQGINGDNITAAKENIEGILETLAKGYEQQLDQLFQSDVIDIASDINVLENMMHQDGLTADKNDLRTLEIGS